MVRLRFLQTVPSMNPDVPFQPGQIISVSSLTEAMRAWVETGAAVLLDAEPEEAAVLGPPSETAVLKRPRARGSS